MDKEQIIALIKREVVPAMGCTEPMAVSLCVAHAMERLRMLTSDKDIVPESINVLLSPNILKNAMGVGIPGTGMIGLPIAIALGALIGKSEYKLEVLRDATERDVEEGKKLIERGIIRIGLKHDITSVMGYDEKLYIEVTCQSKNHEGKAIIAKEHTNVIDEADLMLQSNEQDANTTPGNNSLTLRQVFDFATLTPINELEFINEARRLNETAAAKALEGNYGHQLGKTLSRPLGRGIMGDSIFSHILSKTSAACDARMAGAMIPVMSNSGSGNQGIAATLPVVVFGEENHNTDEEITRALILSHLTAIYIKQSLGRLSALCGCVVASTGSACGMTYLMGGGYDQVAHSVKNMIANLAGMVCDGAKPSCALKVTSGVSTAVLSAMLAVKNNVVTSVEGIIDDDVDRSIQNLTRVGAEGMDETDRLILEIMTNK